MNVDRPETMFTTLSPSSQEAGYKKSDTGVKASVKLWSAAVSARQGSTWDKLYLRTINDFTCEHGKRLC